MIATKANNLLPSTPIERFLDQLQSRHTAKAYQRDLTKLLDFLSSQQTSTQRLSSAQAHAYVDGLIAGGLAPRSIRRHISAARSFYNYLMAQGEVESNPFADVQLPAIPTTSAQNAILSQDEIDACLRVLVYEVQSILEACVDGFPSRLLRRRTFYAIRRRAIVVLLLYTDLRLSELLNLCFTDVEQTSEGFQLAITGSSSRIVPLNGDCLPEFIDWLKIRKDIPTQNQQLFVGFDGAPCTRMSVRQIMKWLQARVRTQHTLNAMLFRRTYLHRQSAATLAGKE